MTETTEAPRPEYPYVWAWEGDPEASGGYTVIGTGADGADVAIAAYDSHAGAAVQPLEQPPQPELEEGEEIVGESPWGVVPAMLMTFEKANELAFRIQDLTVHRCPLSAPRVVRVENGEVVE